MSPRRRIDPATEPDPAPGASPRRRLPVLVAAAVSVVVLGSLCISAAVFATSWSHQRAEIRDVAVIAFVRSFVTQYTSPDPFNANAYADRVLAQGTGEFAKLYRQKMNEIVIQVARSEPGAGTVQDLGIARWNDDGSATVVAVAAMTTTMPDGKKIRSGSRWVVRAIAEGEQWKVSNLIQVL